VINIGARFVGKKVTIEYEDDVDGGAVDAADVVTADFSYKGKDYTLVLNPKNGAQFDADMAPWIAAAKKAQDREAREEARKNKAPAARKPRAARKAPAIKKAPAAKKSQPAPVRKAEPAASVPSAGRRGRKATAAKAPADQNRAIREWAVDKGLNVSKRGRISAEVVEAFNAAH